MSFHKKRIQLFLFFILIVIYDFAVAQKNLTIFQLKSPINIDGIFEPEN